MHSGILRARQVAVFFFFLLSLTLLLVRLFYLQALRHNFYVKIASEQHTFSTALPPQRGTIYDRKMRPLAFNLHCDSVFANPRQITNVRKSAAKLSAILKLDESFVRERLSRDKGFV